MKTYIQRAEELKNEVDNMTAFIGNQFYKDLKKEVQDLIKEMKDNYKKTFGEDIQDYRFFENDKKAIKICREILK